MMDILEMVIGTHMNVWKKLCVVGLQFYVPLHQLLQEKWHWVSIILLYMSKLLTWPFCFILY
jgi:hypothetical protein